jgi:hypothetical protein
VISVPRDAPAWARQFADDVDAALRPRGSPAVLAKFSKTDLPDAARWVGAWIFVTDATGGPTPAYSDGTDWVRCTDATVIS